MSTLTGTGILLRFMLRRDRLRLPLWVGGLTGLTGFFAVALGTVLDVENLAAMAQLAASPITALVTGPGYGFDDITIPRFLVGLYGAYLMLAAAIMSLTTISRHTRVEEEHERAELVLADVVGRHAPLTAALLLAGLMNVLTAVLMAGVILVAPLEPAPGPAPTVLFTTSVAAVGVVFAGVAAVTAQLSPFARTGSALAGVVLAAAFVVRGLGDTSRVQDGDLAWLSWLSPLGWSQQTAPFTLDRWWPLIWSVLCTAVTVVLAFVLRSRRDLGGGALADRLGRAHATPWLRSPLALAYRLQRGTIRGWAVAMLILGLVYGAFTQTIVDSAAGMPAEILGAIGGGSALTEGYLGARGTYFGILLSVFALLAVQSLRAQETGSHTEAVLATAVGRRRWLLSWVVVTALATVWLTALAGLAEGVGAWLATGDSSLVGPTLLGHTVQFAPVWCILGAGAAVYGAAPRILGVVWLPFVAGSVLTFFGPMLQLSQAWLNLSLYEHVGEHPATDVAWTGVAVLVGAGLLLALVGAAAFRRRDLTA